MISSTPISSCSAQQSSGLEDPRCIQIYLATEKKFFAHTSERSCYHGWSIVTIELIYIESVILSEALRDMKLDAISLKGDLFKKISAATKIMSSTKIKPKELFNTGKIFSDVTNEAVKIALYNLSLKMFSFSSHLVEMSFFFKLERDFLTLLLHKIDTFYCTIYSDLVFPHMHVKLLNKSLDNLDKIFSFFHLVFSLAFEREKTRQELPPHKNLTQELLHVKTHHLMPLRAIYDSKPTREKKED